MSRRLHTLWGVLTFAALALTGCHPTQPFYASEDGDLSHYVGVATDIEFPDAESTCLSEVEGALPPLTLDNSKPQEMWDLSLEQAVQLSLQNSKVMRSLGGRFASTAFNPRAQVGEAPDAVLTGPDRVVTVYDPAIIETDPFRGVEPALAAFDAQFASNLLWERNDRPQNVRAGAFGGFFTPVFEQDNSTFNAELRKTTATGGRFALRNNTFYDANNNPTRQIYSDWTTNFEATFAQPLLAGSGVQFNRIAGPLNQFEGITSPQFDGVMLARINTDISLADFEGGVRNLVSDVENAYWELYFSYRNLEASKEGRSSALQTWKKIHSLYVEGARGGEAEKEAQASEQYYLFHGQVQTALNDLYRAENRLRYVMGLAVSDGRLVRPCDEPTTAQVSFDWFEIHAEGLTRSVELRRQKWRLKQRELELIAARNLLQPRLDAIGRYRWLGLGDDLIDSDGNNPPNPVTPLAGTNAFESLTGGDFQEWQLGLQMTMPIGFRRELATIRHYQLQLARERARLQDQELEVSHQLGDALRILDFNYELTETNFNRRVAAEKQVRAVRAAFEAETVTLDLLLDAQRRRADAEIAYYRTLVDYNRAVMQVHYRKGSLLEYNDVYLAEGPWPAKAQFDAHRLARQRDASYYMDYGFTRPRVISRGPYEQFANPGGVMEHGDGMVPEGEMQYSEPEEVPVPTPAKPRPEPEAEPSTATRRQRATAQVPAPSAAARPIARPAQPKAAAETAAPKKLAAAAPANTPKRLDASKSQVSYNPAAAKPVARLSIEQPKQTTSASAKLVVDRAAASAALPPDRRNTAIEQATYQWKSSSQHEPFSNPTTDSNDRPASGWKRAEL